MDYVIKERNLDISEVISKISLDDGNEFLKVTLSVFDLCESANPNSKESDVKKRFLIEIAPCVPENCVNVKRLWFNLGIDNQRYEYIMAADLKLRNILLGLMTRQSPSLLLVQYSKERPFIARLALYYFHFA